MMRVLAVTAGSALTLLGSGCESTEHQSARLGREGAGLIASTHTAILGGVNHQVRVGRTVILHGSGRTAVAVQLQSTSTQSQANVPVLIDVQSAKGASLYRNDIAGDQTSLHELALLRARKRTWWVDDQVLASGVPKSVRVRVGNPKRRFAARAAPQVRLSGLHLGSDVAGPYIAGVVINRSRAAQHDMPLYAVALHDGRVVAAGRALVPSLPVGVTKQPTVFRIYFVGNPTGARIQLTTAPSIQS